MQKLPISVWANTIAQSYTNPPVFHRGVELPGFPSDQLQVQTTGQAGLNTLKEAFFFYQDCIETFNELDISIRDDTFLLDFGVGWGRVARFFINEIPQENIFGVDVREDFIDVCRRTFRNNNFYVTEPFPPTSLPDGKFNIIVGYSVFSHLSESACKRWMEEFYRILAPGGVVAVTTRGRPFFDYCESLKGKGHTGYPEALSNLFEDFSDARMRYDNGEFVHSNRQGVTGGGALDGSFYGETFIPEKYAREAYCDLFVLTKFLFNPVKDMHPRMFFRRK